MEFFGVGHHSLSCFKLISFRSDGGNPKIGDGLRERCQEKNTVLGHACEGMRAPTISRCGTKAATCMESHLLSRGITSQKYRVPRPGCREKNGYTWSRTTRRRGTNARSVNLGLGTKKRSSTLRASLLCLHKRASLLRTPAAMQQRRACMMGRGGMRGANVTAWSNRIAVMAYETH